jgi:hypothetical protein
MRILAIKGTFLAHCFPARRVGHQAAVVRIYADRPGTGLRQFVADLFVVVWVGFWIWVATWVYDAVNKLAVPGQKMEGAGERMAGGLSEAGDKVGGIPAVGDELASPFDQAAGAAESLAEAGRDQQAAVQNLAVLLVVLLLIVPLSLVLFVWLPLRIRWIRRASYATALRGGRTGRDLLALRALANQPLRRLARVHADPAGAWRDGDEAVVTSLAALELRSLGLTPR